MFGKLLKHDFKAVFRYWWLLLLSIPVVSIAIGLAIRLGSTVEIPEYNFPILHILLVLFIVFAVIALAASAIVTPILSLIRFYKHFYTDEGYLTFTLPVRRSTLLLSKIVNAVIFDTMYAILMVVSIASAILIALPGEEVHAFFRGFYDFFSFCTEQWEVGLWVILYVLESILLLVALDLFSNLLLYFCVTIGALVVKKAKLVVGLVIYYGVNTALNFAMRILSYIVLPLTSGELVNLIGGLSGHASLGAFALILLILISIVAAFAFTLFSMTLGRLERKLNLA